MSDVRYRKVNGIIEAYVINETVISRFTPEQFEFMITTLDEQVKQDPKALGDSIIAQKQVDLTQLQAAKAALTEVSDGE